MLFQSYILDNFYFGLKIDFVTNVVPAVNLLSENIYVADGGTGGKGNADMTIKIILKNNISASYFKLKNMNKQEVKPRLQEHSPRSQE